MVVTVRESVRDRQRGGKRRHSNFVNFVEVEDFRLSFVTFEGKLIDMLGFLFFLLG